MSGMIHVMLVSACYDTGQWINYIGGPGYWLIFSSDDINTIEVEILVDMALGENQFSYVSEIVE